MAKTKPTFEEKIAQYEPHIQAASKKYGVPTQVIKEVMRQESGGNSGATSGAGAGGLMQIMPATAKGLGVKNRFDPAQSIEGGTKYLAQQYKTFGRWDYAAAAYNAGPGAVKKYKGIPPYKETQNYVKNIMGRLTSGDPQITGTLGPKGQLSDGQMPEWGMPTENALPTDESQPVVQLDKFKKMTAGPGASELIDALPEDESELMATIDDDEAGSILDELEADNAGDKDAEGVFAPNSISGPISDSEASSILNELEKSSDAPPMTDMAPQTPIPSAPPAAPNQRGAMDYISEALLGGPLGVMSGVGNTYDQLIGTNKDMIPVSSMSENIDKAKAALSGPLSMAMKASPQNVLSQVIDTLMNPSSLKAGPSQSSSLLQAVEKLTGANAARETKPAYAAAGDIATFFTGPNQAVNAVAGKVPAATSLLGKGAQYVGRGAAEGTAFDALLNPNSDAQSLALSGLVGATANGVLGPAGVIYNKLKALAKDGVFAKMIDSTMFIGPFIKALREKGYKDALKVFDDSELVKKDLLESANLEIKEAYAKTKADIVTSIQQMSPGDSATIGQKLQQAVKDIKGALSKKYEEIVTPLLKNFHPLPAKTQTLVDAIDKELVSLTKASANTPEAVNAGLASLVKFGNTEKATLVAELQMWKKTLQEADSVTIGDLEIFRTTMQDKAAFDKASGGTSSALYKRLYHATKENVLDNISFWGGEETKKTLSAMRAEYSVRKTGLDALKSQVKPDPEKIVAGGSFTGTTITKAIAANPELKPVLKDLVTKQFSKAETPKQIKGLTERINRDVLEMLLGPEKTAKIFENIEKLAIKAPKPTKFIPGKGPVENPGFMAKLSQSSFADFSEHVGKISGTAAKLLGSRGASFLKAK